MYYITKYPKTVSLMDGITEKISVDQKTGVEELHIVVKESLEKIQKIFAQEGASKVKFEHKQEYQIGNGLSIKLKKPWEMHVRLFDIKKGMISIQAEVEISRDYLQHLFSQRTAVIYEIEDILKKHKIEKLPVVDSKKNLVGLITFRDINKHSIKSVSNKERFSVDVFCKASASITSFLRSNDLKVPWTAKPLFNN